MEQFLEGVKHEQSRTVLVTGGSGFIGSALVIHLLEKTNWRVINFDKQTYAAVKGSLASVTASARYVLRPGDVADPHAVRTVFEEFEPDYVFHLAAESHVDASIDLPEHFVRTNVQGTLTMLQAALHHYEHMSEARQKEFRFIHFSTDEVYGSLDCDSRRSKMAEPDSNTGTKLADASAKVKEKFTPASPYQPNSPYAASKASADMLVRAWHHTYNLPTIILNSSNNYGPRQYPEKLIPKMILLGLRGESLPVFGSGQHVRDWIHVEDTAEAVLLAALRGDPGSVYLIGANCERTNLEVVRDICEFLDKHDPQSAPHANRIKHVVDRPGHDQRYAIDASETTQALGWNPKFHDFGKGLAQTIRWYLENAGWWQPLLGTQAKGGDGCCELGPMRRQGLRVLSRSGQG
eukprot:gnl/TRDRNA2_/TRDRNA2_159210_c1_seq1.p1 gnl/TRDRNA2_/TRDRNA2_159210_c1~~gnl/TRDRNA2_/TRDRNA2_159210_c1_seq1.p1  ORF type:complete len:406 (+),score=48.94 gnl/TRDRNA2_/TRDRNA2_159210_c1_seq1:2-1219(+)